ncbi:MAG: hypothetical protein RLZZ334_302, partial [Actinomycetota bacterium]
GFHRRVWCPKWTPLSRSSRIVTTAMTAYSFLGFFCAAEQNPLGLWLNNLFNPSHSKSPTTISCGPRWLCRPKPVSAEMSSLIREDAGQILPERERGNYRPIRRKTPHAEMRSTASKAIAKDILLTPWARSIKVIGTSATDPPRAIARRVISI